MHDDVGRQRVRIALAQGTHGPGDHALLLLTCETLRKVQRHHKSSANVPDRDGWNPSDTDDRRNTAQSLFDDINETRSRADIEGLDRIHQTSRHRGRVDEREVTPCCAHRTHLAQTRR